LTRWNFYLRRGLTRIKTRINADKNMYELKLEQFSGPIEKLLELIEERRLEITELSLAEVTADFLRYIQILTNTDTTRTDTDKTRTDTERGPYKSVFSPLESVPMARLLADFIVIASQLLLIKSKALLPNLHLTEEEEKDIKDLQSRLHFYQQFKPAMGYLKKFWEQNNISISRPLFFGRPAFFYPAENIKIEELYKAINKIFEVFNEISKSEVIKSSLISLEEKIEEIIKRLSADSRVKCADKRGKVNFTELMDGKPRSEIVVLFLALLHLLANQLIRVEQKQRFENIMIEKK